MFEARNFKFGVLTLYDGYYIQVQNQVKGA